MLPAGAVGLGQETRVDVINLGFLKVKTVT